MAQVCTIGVLVLAYCTHDNVCYRVDMENIEIHKATNGERHAELAGAWLISLPNANTQRAYRGDLLSWFMFLDNGGQDALSAERKHVDLWRATLDGASSTVARRLAAVSSFYTYAQGEGATERQPVQNVKRPHVDADFSATRGLSKDEARRFIDAARADNARSYALAALLLLTGVRISEALNANLSDLQHDAGHRVLVVTRKGGKRQKVAIPAPVIDALSAYLGANAAHGTEIVDSDSSADDKPIFTTATGARWASSEAFRTVGRLARNAGIDGHVSPHSMRHTHATLALDAGVALRDLQDSMGHADPRTTRRYDRARGQLERSSAYSVASALA
jgi:integrase/recombinase XerD